MLPYILCFLALALAEHKTLVHLPLFVGVANGDNFGLRAQRRYLLLIEEAEKLLLTCELRRRLDDRLDKDWRLLLYLRLLSILPFLTRGTPGGRNALVRIRGGWLRCGCNRRDCDKDVLRQLNVCSSIDSCEIITKLFFELP